MANSTDEYWTIDNVSLHQFGWSVTTFGGSRWDLPPRRGSNITLAYRPGQIHKPKLPDSRPIILAMWVTGGYDLASGNPATDQRLAFNDSWDFLRQLVWRVEGRQFRLGRRWMVTVAGTPQMVVADAQAELTGTMTPTMTGRTRADFAMDLFLADPFFYGPPVGTGGLGIPVARNVTTSVVNPGNDIAGYGNFEVDLIGPLTNPKLTNTAPDPDVWVKYTGTIATGRTLTLKVATFQALRDDGPNLIKGISHYGARHWFGLQPGANPVTLTSDTGTGSALLRFRPPYV